MKTLKIILLGLLIVGMIWLMLFIAGKLMEYTFGILIFVMIGVAVIGLIIFIANLFGL